MRKKIQSKGHFIMLIGTDCVGQSMALWLRARALGHTANFPVLLMNGIPYPRGNLIPFHLLQP